MKLSNAVYYWFTWFVLCFISYQQIIDNFRPNYHGENLTLRYLLGIAPNFFPAIGIPALFVILIPQFNLTSKWFKEYRHFTANSIAFIGLISWEFIQSTSSTLHFDWNDILWTFFGASVFQLIWTLTPKKLKELDSET